RQMKLTEAHLGSITEQGFTVLPGLLSADELGQWLEEIDGLEERMALEAPPGVGLTWEPSRLPGQPRRLIQLLHADLVTQRLRDLVASDTLVDLAEPVLGEDIGLFHAKRPMKS